MTQEVQLRDGTVVDDPRLGRLKSWSRRSLLFPLEERLALDQLDTKPLRSYTWVPSVTLNQTHWSGCVSWTLSYDLDAPPQKVRPQTDAAALERYFRIQDRDEWPGSERPGDPLGHYGGTSVRAGADQMIAEGWYSRYDWADLNDPVKATGQILAAIAYRGPCPIGLDWMTGMDQADADGFIHATGTVRGGHSILAVGVSMRWSCVYLKQSWGDPALLKLPWHDLTTVLDRGGESYSPTRTTKTAAA